MLWRLQLQSKLAWAAGSDYKQGAVTRITTSAHYHPRQGLTQVHEFVAGCCKDATSDVVECWIVNGC